MPSAASVVHAWSPDRRISKATRNFARLAPATCAASAVASKLSARSVAAFPPLSATPAMVNLTFLEPFGAGALWSGICCAAGPPSGTAVESYRGPSSTAGLSVVRHCDQHLALAPGPVLVGRGEGDVVDAAVAGHVRVSAPLGAHPGRRGPDAVPVGGERPSPVVSTGSSCRMPGDRDPDVVPVRVGDALDRDRDELVVRRPDLAHARPGVDALRRPVAGATP